MPAICRLPAHYCATQQCGLAKWPRQIKINQNAIQCVFKFNRVIFLTAPPPPPMSFEKDRSMENKRGEIPNT